MSRSRSTVASSANPVQFPAAIGSTFVLAIAVCLAFLAKPRWAQAEEPASGSGTPKEPTIEELFQDLDQRHRILERKIEIESEARATREKDAPKITAGKEGFSLSSAGGEYVLKFTGLLHADGRFFVDDQVSDATSTFVLRRVRPTIQGTLFKYLDLLFRPDFGNGQVVIQDAYAELKYLSWLKLRVGKFKEPVGLERLQSASDIEFVERGLPTAIVPNRDIGAQLGGEVLDGAVQYAFGAFNGVPDGGSGDVDSNDDKDLAARIFLQPFKKLEFEPLAGLGFGVAGTYGRQEGAAPSYRTFGQQVFFAYASGVTADGDRYRVSPQFYYSYGALGVLGEYAHSNLELLKGSTRGREDAQAWQIAVTYLLTGESASYKGVVPLKPFDLFEGNWGAIELVARYGQLSLARTAFNDGFADPAVSARRADEVVLGVNWYLNKNLKFVLDYAHTDFDGGGKPDREAENVIVGRVQVAF